MSVVNVRVANLRPTYKNLCQWMQHPDHVYVGRRGCVFIDNQRFPPTDSIWHNPFKLGSRSRSECINLYETYIRKRLAEEPDLVQALLSLKGKTLGCYCAPEPCHGHVLLRLVDEYTK